LQNPTELLKGGLENTGKSQTGILKKTIEIPRKQVGAGELHVFQERFIKLCKQEILKN
jgi:hypothetical protein